MTALELTKALRSIGKGFYTLSDLEKVTGLDRASLYVALSRLAGRGVIDRVCAGIYVLSGEPPPIERIAMETYAPCYLSFESALSLHGVLNLVPKTTTFATTRKSRKVFLAGRSVEFRQIKEDLFGGFELKNGFHMASAEKALLDLLYLVSLGKESLPEAEMDLRRISAPAIVELSERYPPAVASRFRKLFGRIG